MTKDVNIQLRISKLLAKGMTMDDNGNFAPLPPNYMVEVTIDGRRDNPVQIDTAEQGAREVGDALGVVIADAIRALAAGQE